MEWLADPTAPLGAFVLAAVGCAIPFIGAIHGMLLW